MVSAQRAGTGSRLPKPGLFGKPETPSGCLAMSTAYEGLLLRVFGTTRTSLLAAGLYAWQFEPASSGQFLLRRETPRRNRLVPSVEDKAATLLPFDCVT